MTQSLKAPNSRGEGDELPILDRQRLHARLSGDEPLIVEVSQMLLEDAPRLAGECDAALTASALPEAHRAAHTLKGAAANLCAERLARAAERVEQLVVAGEVEAARSACHALLREVTALEPELLSVIVAGGNGPGSAAGGCR